jgi:ABC-type branched-subunit amino acid transport system ATPase component/ABC-type branched-subunit amino acid transport system permease subunit
MSAARLKTAAIILLVAVLATVPFLPLTKYQLHLINLIAISSILAMSLDLLFGYLGQMSLAHASFYGIGAYVSALLTTHGIVPFWIAMPIAMVVCAGFGFVLGIPTMRLTGFYLAMATMSFSIIMSTLFVQSVDITGGPNGLLNIPPPRFFGTELIGPQRGLFGNYYYLLVASGAVTYAFIWRLTTGQLGRTIVGIRENAIAAASVGINVRLVQVAVFAVSCMLAGLAGSLYAHLILYISPETFTFGNSLLALLAVVLGGIGTIWGPIIGAAILTLLGEVMRQFGAYQLVIYACALLLVISLIPHGISGLLTLLARRKPAADAAPQADDTTVVPLDSLQNAVARGAPANTLLSVTGVSKRFGGVQALRDVSFTVHEGEIKAVIGPNGSGKSTLFNLVSGFDRANNGVIEFGGKPIGGLPAYQIARAGMARSFQIVQLFGRMTLRENLLLAGQRQHGASLLSCLLGLRAARDADRRNAAAADWLLREAGLFAQRNQAAATLPYGRQRILEIARALATNPRLILLDEPAAGLNTAEAFELAAYLRKIRIRGVTILIVEHNMPFILGLADNVVVLDTGRKIADAKPAVIRRDEHVIAAYLGTPAEAIGA